MYRNLLFSLQKYFRTQKTYENVLHEYNFTTKILFRRRHASDDTPVLP